MKGYSRVILPHNHFIVSTLTVAPESVLKTHFMIAAVIPPIFYFLWPAIIIPVALGVISHLFSDLADINKSSAG